MRVQRAEEGRLEAPRRCRVGGVLMATEEVKNEGVREGLNGNQL